MFDISVGKILAHYNLPASKLSTVYKRKALQNLFKGPNIDMIAYEDHREMGNWCFYYTGYIPGRRQRGSSESAPSDAIGR